MIDPVYIALLICLLVSNSNRILRTSRWLFNYLVRITSEFEFTLRAIWRLSTKPKWLSHKKDSDPSAFRAWQKDFGNLDQKNPNRLQRRPLTEANPKVRRINFDATERVGDTTTRLPTLFRPNWPHDTPSELDTTPERRDSFPCRRRHCPRTTHGWNDTMCNVVDLSNVPPFLAAISSCGIGIVQCRTGTHKLLWFDLDRIASNLRSGWYASSSLCCQAGIEPQGVSLEAGSTLPSCCSGLSSGTGRCCYLRHALAALLDLGFDLYPATDSRKAWDNGEIMAKTRANAKLVGIWTNLASLAKEVFPDAHPNQQHPRSDDDEDSPAPKRRGVSRSLRPRMLAGAQKAQAAAVPAKRIVALGKGWIQIEMDEDTA
ncbi:hypothetical protein C8F04DRAFT_1177491 [Mycena alexandri]|uniref:Uncharacterized protein n=1 Tax=Mycena alexandri TaxID=1745969 RepID=A0AAD6T9E7_9AGAR|nr:hypothetical protein C8F04DRAFT_1177491 [Mycena alexandri]